MIRQTLIVGDVLSNGIDLQNLQALNPSLEVVARVSDLHQLTIQLSALKSDTLLVNMDLPGIRFLNSVRILGELLPAVSYLYIIFKPVEQVHYLPRTGNSPDLAGTITRARDQMYPELSAKILHEFKRMAAGQVSVPVTSGNKTALPLTKRELEVVSLLAKGYGDKKIAEILVISEKTVRNHIRNVRQKIRVKTRTQVVLFAVQAGLVNIDEICLDAF
ncbi:MAG TPA: response regulator transcription factor [Bacillota bacterium]|nr:response regulator transcription factor [Bacillota bacterium]